jgi:uncharacterized protein
MGVPTLLLHMQKSIKSGMKFGGFDWDSGNRPKCLSHGVSLPEIEALFAGDIYIVRDTILAGERRVLGFGKGAGRWIFFSLHLASKPNSTGQRSLHARQGDQTLCRRNFPT